MGKCLKSWKNKNKKQLTKKYQMFWLEIQSLFYITMIRCDTTTDYFYSFPSLSSCLWKHRQELFCWLHCTFLCFTLINIKLSGENKGYFFNNRVRRWKKYWGLIDNIQSTCEKLLLNEFLCICSHQLLFWKFKLKLKETFWYVQCLE